MMKRLFAGVFLLSSLLASAQISPVLEEKLESPENQFLPITIHFASKVDMDELKNRMDVLGIHAEERPRLVNRSLMKQAKSSQAEVLKKLNQYGPNQVKSITSFYIVNLVIVEATKQVIYDLQKYPGVIWLDWAGGDFIFDEPIIEKGASTESVSGVEPGLIAINAPPMWDLGYTGRGRLAYLYDTGVETSHPAFSDRFLGNFAPLSQCWYGYLSDFPTAKGGEHGTHVLGTTAGLDKRTNDTIGVAFGSYWIANDLISHASLANQLPPLVLMFQAFEWALNPDGDTATSDDVPDVINNSWRWRDEDDTVQCGGVVPQLMNTIEAAGIANIFSGGNSGPNNTSVNGPQRINTSKTNTFSVGSVNGNMSFPYPISSFSTRGPTQCPGTGNLLIHPEVVAPGQNVRSAWGKDGFNTISGTSMASPHVSGAVLLLKEAFPQLTGSELMYALYSSAVDLGVAGEDNTYGNGVIDVYAAFQLLSQTYTPVNPNQVGFDLAIVDHNVAMEGQMTCDTVVSLWLLLENRGDSSLSTLTSNIWMNGVQLNGSPISINASGLVARGDTQWVNIMNNIPITAGGDVVIRVEMEHGNTDFDPVNNKRYIRFNQRPAIDLPFIEDFTSAIGRYNWFTGNDDGSISWDSITITGTNDIAAFMNMADYFPRANQKDYLFGPVLRLPQSSKLTMKFDVAYREYANIGLFHDSLRIYASTDCGETFDHLIYDNWGAGLNTTGTTGPDFFPMQRSEWRRDSVDLTFLAGQEVMIIFETVSRQGNNLFLDNIHVYEGAKDPVALPEVELRFFEVYPNPAHDRVFIKSGVDGIPIEFQVYDIRGSKLLEGVFRDAIDLSGIPEGVYFIDVQQSDRVQQTKLLKL